MKLSSEDSVDVDIDRYRYRYIYHFELNSIHAHTRMLHADTSNTLYAPCRWSIDWLAN